MKSERRKLDINSIGLDLVMFENGYDLIDVSLMENQVSLYDLGREYVKSIEIPLWVSTIRSLRYYRYVGGECLSEKDGSGKRFRDLIKK